MGVCKPENARFLCIFTGWCNMLPETSLLCLRTHESPVVRPHVSSAHQCKIHPQQLVQAPCRHFSTDTSLTLPTHFCSSSCACRTAHPLHILILYTHAYLPALFLGQTMQRALVCAGQCNFLTFLSSAPQSGSPAALKRDTHSCTLKLTHCAISCVGMRWMPLHVRKTRICRAYCLLPLHALAPKQCWCSTPVWIHTRVLSWVAGTAHGLSLLCCSC